MTTVLPQQLDRLEAHENPVGFDSAAIRAFNDETRASGGAELANSQSIISDLCIVLGVKPPNWRQSRHWQSQVATIQGICVTAAHAKTLPDTTKWYAQWYARQGW